MSAPEVAELLALSQVLGPSGRWFVQPTSALCGEVTTLNPNRVCMFAHARVRACHFGSFCFFISLLSPLAPHLFPLPPSLPLSLLLLLLLLPLRLNHIDPLNPRLGPNCAWNGCRACMRQWIGFWQTLAKGEGEKVARAEEE